MASTSAHARLAVRRSAPARAAEQEADLEGRLVSLTTLNWGNSAPLALAAFGVTTFMLSMINANQISPTVKPVVFGVALMFGGLTQLIAGIIQLRTGNTFSGVLFTGFGGFWMSLFAVAQWFLKAVPTAQVGHGLGLFLYAFGIFAAVMWFASFRTNVIVVSALGILVATFFLLGTGNYGAHPALIHWGGYLGSGGGRMRVLPGPVGALRGVVRPGGVPGRFSCHLPGTDTPPMAPSRGQAIAAQDRQPAEPPGPPRHPRRPCEAATPTWSNRPFGVTRWPQPSGCLARSTTDPAHDVVSPNCNSRRPHRPDCSQPSARQGAGLV